MVEHLQSMATAARKTAKSYKTMLAQVKDMAKPQLTFPDEVGGGGGA